MSSKKQETPKAAPKSASKKVEAPKGPSEADLKKALQMWMAGGVSLWDVKKKTGIHAAILQPAFEKALGKKLAGPGQRYEAKGKKSAAKEEKTRRAA
jgi:hypothetical protein